VQGVPRRQCRPQVAVKPLADGRHQGVGRQERRRRRCTRGGSRRCRVAGEVLVAVSVPGSRSRSSGAAGSGPVLSKGGVAGCRPDDGGEQRQQVRQAQNPAAGRGMRQRV